MNCKLLEELSTEDLKHVQLGTLLGEGSGGKVYKADLRGSVLAVKTIECYDEKCQINIDREVNGLKKCIHENIIKMLGLKKDGLTSLIMMEFAECGSLNDYLFPMKGPRQEYSESTAVDWMQQLAKGVAYLHSRKKPVIHRDLKPANLLLTQNYKVLKISDFGCVREQTASMTTEVGTVEYMDPEMAKTSHYKASVDVYSCGIVFWTIKTRKIPFSHLNNPTIAITILGKALKGERPPIDDVSSDSLKSLISLCWHADPQKRYSMEKVVIELNKIAADL